MAKSVFNATEITKTEARAKVRSAVVVDATVKKQFAKMSKDLQNRVADTIRIGIQQGRTTGTIARMISGGVVDGVPMPGIAKATRAQANALVHSAVISASAKDRLAVFRENSDVIKAIQQVSTLDNRTTDICIAYSNATWDVETLSPIGHDLPFDGGPPRHYRCRSVIVPVIKSPQELGVQVKDKIPPEIRASMNGQVAGDLSFRDFLKNHPPEFAEQLLGPERAKLFMSGKINERDLLNSSGEPLTPDQLLKLAKSGDAPATYKGTGFTKIELDEQSEVMFDTEFDKLGFKQRKEVIKASKAGSLALPSARSVGAAQATESQFGDDIERYRAHTQSFFGRNIRIDERIYQDFNYLMKQAEFEKNRLEQIQSLLKLTKKSYLPDVFAKLNNTIRDALTVARKSQVTKFLETLKGQPFEAYRQYTTMSSTYWRAGVVRSRSTMHSYEEYRRMKALYDQAIGRNNAVYDYVGNAYNSLNAALRQGKQSLKTTHTHVEDLYKGLSQAFSKFNRLVGEKIFTEDTILFRGVPDSAFRNPPPGKVILFKGFVSSSTNPETAFGFAKGEASNQTAVRHIYEILVPKGSKGVLAGFNEGESEILFETGAKFISAGNRYESYEVYGRTVTVHVTRLIYNGY